MNLIDTFKNKERRSLIGSNLFLYGRRLFDDDNNNTRKEK